jgi:hypothetical protein
MNNNRIRLNFVHLGFKLPRYLLLNIERCAEIFEDVEVELATNLNRNLTLKVPTKTILVEYVPSSKTNQILGKIEHNQSFRNNFWRLSIERLIVVIEQVIQDNIPRLHIESDMVLFSNFSFEWLKSVETVMWCKYSNDRDSAAMLFLPNRECASLLLESLYEEFEKDPTHTDMSVLRSIADSRKFPYEYFPSAEVEKDGSTVSDVDSTPAWNIKIDCNLSLKCAFDSASFGMWLTGQDVRNNFGLLVLHEDFSSVKEVTKPRDYVYKVDDNCGHIEIQNANQVLALVCLHVHSKEERLFEKDNKEAFKAYVNLSNDKKVSKKLKTKLFARYLLEGLSDGSILRVYSYLFLKKLKERS